MRVPIKKMEGKKWCPVSLVYCSLLAVYSRMTSQNMFFLCVGVQVRETHQSFPVLFYSAKFGAPTKGRHLALG